MANEVSTQREPRPIEAVKQALQAVPFEDSLPSNIDPAKFRTAALTAINLNPDLLGADRSSLLTACMRSAADGLLPDNREATLQVYNAKIKRNGEEQWVKMVTYMPMSFGIIKRLRNSGEIASITAHVVYEADHFEYVLGDDERIDHRPSVNKDRGEIVAAYAIAKFKDGSEPQREVMMRSDIDRVRASSKSATGPAWSNWTDEMSRKSVVKRLSKYLPMSAENIAFLERAVDDAPSPTAVAGPDHTDAQYAEVVTLGPPKATPTSKLDHFEAEVVQVVDKPKKTKAKETAPPNGLDGVIAAMNAQSTRSALAGYWQSDEFQEAFKGFDLDQQAACRKNYTGKLSSLPEEEIDDVI